MMAKRMAEMMAVGNESIINPSTSLDVRTNNPALIINVNSPKEIKVIGKVSSLITGLIKVVTIPQTRAVISRA